jgi:hypothetical protein
VKRKKSREQPVRAVHCTALSIHFLTLVEITFVTNLSFFIQKQIKTKQNHNNKSTEKNKKTKISTTRNNGYLGSRDDEERSEMRYVVRIANVSESSNL